MEYELYSVLFLSGIVGGLLSGLVGVGGGIIMFPLLLYAPPMFGLAALSIKTSAAITAVHSLFGALSGAIAHQRHRCVYWPLARDFGGAMTVTSLIGSVASIYVSERWILILFALMAVVAAILMLFPRPEVEPTRLETPAPPYSRPRAWLLGAVIGVCAGLIGQGGGFLFVPVLMAFLAMPLRISIGTALAVGVASSLAVVLGRLGTGQIPWLLTAITVSGGVIGAQIGAELSQRMPRRILRTILAIAVMGTAIKMLYGLAVGPPI